MSDLTFVQGDTEPPIRATLKRKLDDGSYEVLNLTTAGVTAVRFQMRRADDTIYTVDAPATVEDPVTGKVRYEWADNDLSVPGDDYIAQWQLSFGAKEQTTDPYGTITVRRQ